MFNSVPKKTPSTKSCPQHKNGVALFSPVKTPKQIQILQPATWRRCQNSTTQRAQTRAFCEQLKTLTRKHAPYHKRRFPTGYGKLRPSREKPVFFLSKTFYFGSSHYEYTGVGWLAGWRYFHKSLMPFFNLRHGTEPTPDWPGRTVFPSVSGQPH